MHELSEQFLQAAAIVDGAEPSIEGFQAGQPCLEVRPGPLRYRRTQSRGRRLTAFDTFLKRHLDDANLRFHLQASVEKILFDGDKAVGVEVRNGSGNFTLRALKGVILSAGAIHSPRCSCKAELGRPVS